MHVFFSQRYFVSCFQNYRTVFTNVCTFFFYFGVNDLFCKSLKYYACLRVNLTVFFSDFYFLTVTWCFLSFFFTFVLLVHGQGELRASLDTHRLDEMNVYSFNFRVNSRYFFFLHCRLMNISRFCYCITRFIVFLFVLIRSFFVERYVFTHLFID